MTTEIDDYEYTDFDLKVIAGMHKAVEDRGSDWLYPRYSENLLGEEVYNEDWTREGSCLYVKDDLTPACIVGYALTEAGVAARDMQVLASSDELIKSLDLDVSGRVKDALTRAQAAQDDGCTWGDALDRFGRTLATGSYYS